MEYNLPPVIGPEQFARLEPQPKKKALWNLFEAFRRSPAEEEKPEQARRTPPVTAEIAPVEPTAPERTPEAPRRRRRFGASIMALLRGETAPTGAPERTRTAEPKETKEAPGDREHADTPEQTAEPTIIERAHEVGRGVLRLLTHVKEEVVAADQREQVVTPTDTEPLAEADERVRNAMRELIAPIEAYAAERGITEPAREAAQPDLAAPDHTPSGGDGDRLPEQSLRLPVLETATAVAAATAEAVMDRTAERATKRRHRLGMFAVGAATVGVLVYNWRRQRALTKEQRALKKEYKRFEREVHTNNEDHRKRIEQLEQIEVATLTQAQRQEHVHEVSRFATRQAEVIHAVAAHRHETRQATMRQHQIEYRRRVPDRVPAPTFALPPEQLPAQVQPELQPAVTFAEAPRRTFMDNEVRSAERPQVRPGAIERAIEVLAKPKSVAQAESGTSGGGGLGGWAQTIKSLTTGQSPAEPAVTQTQSSTPQPATPPRRTGQEWLLGVSLAIGVAGVLLLLTTVL